MLQNLIELFSVFGWQGNPLRLDRVKLNENTIVCLSVWFICADGEDLEFAVHLQQQNKPNLDLVDSN